MSSSPEKNLDLSYIEIMWWPFSSSTEEPISYDTFDQMETGDIFLFEGQDYWFSHLVEWATWSDFSHISMVLRDPTYIDPKLKGLYLLESGTEKFPDAVEHRIHFGVQIVDLKKVIDSYTGKIWFRKLSAPTNVKATFPGKLVELWSKIKDLPYDDSIWDLLQVEFDVNRGDVNRTNSFFCSALQTYMYDNFDLFSEHVDWDLVKPSEYNQGGWIETKFKEDISLEDNIRIK